MWNCTKILVRKRKIKKTKQCTLQGTENIYKLKKNEKIITINSNFLMVTN